MLKVRAMEGSDIQPLEIVWSIMTSKINAIWCVFILLPTGMFAWGYWENTLYKFEGTCLLIVIIVLSLFTFLAARAMVRRRSLLEMASLPKPYRDHLQRLLLTHAIATCTANGTAIVYLFCSAMVIRQHWDENVFFVTFAIDNICNVLCALNLSGLVEAVWLASQRMLADRRMFTDGGQPDDDILANFEATCHVARTRTTGAETVFEMSAPPAPLSDDH